MLGLKRCVVPLLGDGDGPARYAVTLYFADPDNEEPDSAACQVKLQGGDVVPADERAEQSRDGRTTLVRRYDNIEVSDNLEIELAPGDEDASAGAALPMLCGLEVSRPAEPEAPKRRTIAEALRY